MVSALVERINLTSPLNLTVVIPSSIFAMTGSPSEWTRQWSKLDPRYNGTDTVIGKAPAVRFLVVTPPVLPSGSREGMNMSRIVSCVLSGAQNGMSLCSIVRCLRRRCFSRTDIPKRSASQSPGLWAPRATLWNSERCPDVSASCMARYQGTREDSDSLDSVTGRIAMKSIS